MAVVISEIEVSVETPQEPVNESGTVKTVSTPLDLEALLRRREERAARVWAH
jgi:hypothetical protein